MNVAALRAWWGKVPMPVSNEPVEIEVVEAQRVSAGRTAAPQKEVDSWYRNYVLECQAARKSPNTHEDEQASKLHFAGRHNRERLRDARARLAPEAWKADGKRRRLASE